jgi:hypothetical protein
MKMKKRIIMVILGIAFIWAPTSIVSAGNFCLDIVGVCNDVKLFYKSTGPNFWSIDGYEHGCAVDVLLDGNARVVGNMLYIQYNQSYVVPSASYRICNWNIEINLDTNEGPCAMNCHYESYHTYDGTARIVPCPVSTPEVLEENVAILER